MTKITRLLPQHLAQVWGIESDVHMNPWSKKTVYDLDSRGALHHVMSDSDGHVLGYYYAQNIVGEISLLNIAIAKQHQGKGYGKVLLQHLIDEARKCGAESIWLEVRSSNKTAQSLYHSLEFNDVDIRSGYYPCKDGGREDAIIMSLYID
ncbi:ribosomal protein S18-alanine N-acetyltransferase [Vibrio viridaestus]|uniref:[Ribosomal protein bS18]-alanine N-acetyltransferase n=1 Tax=Vibrio viridaestus TaxID=2487322 RepID=A0A3N9U2V6_9VIBR|nr:ribosomal protein S18-alanine N-acetyltransferase [Vibrio viridaestus]RQW63872.1 ribosomal-protein-alanine N-acetyltransferase [Vibrio viridaestus]